MGVRQALGIQDGVENIMDSTEKNRNKLIYCSREHETSRSVENEQEILDAITENFDKLEVVVFEGTKSGDSLEDIMSLFSEAAVVMGPHGAGLSHMLFSQGKTEESDDQTTIVEFQFMRDPPMMFWHLAETLDLDYWMVPVPASYWMMDEMLVSVDEVMDILHETVPQFASASAEESTTSHNVTKVSLGTEDESVIGISSGTCPRGSMRVSSENGTKCVLCPPGTYKFQYRDEERCRSCFHGRYSSGYGNVACRTCPIGTFASSSTSCTPCPEESVSWMPGGFDVEEHCLSKPSHLKLMNDIDRKLKGLDHISPEGALRVRRAMLECPDFNHTVEGFSGAYVDGFSGPYVDGFSGPYVDGFSGPYVDGFSGPYVGGFSGPYVGGFSGNGTDINCDVLNPAVMASSAFVTNSTCSSGLAEVNSRQCATCDVSKAFMVSNACASLLPPLSSNQEPSEACCRAAEYFNNGGCFCDVQGLKVAREFDIYSSFISSISDKCSFMPMDMDTGNCPRGSSMRAAANEPPSQQPSSDGDNNDDSDSVALWALLLLIIPAILVIVLLWKLFSACCCRSRAMVG